jgi:hypothetical protein
MPTATFTGQYLHDARSATPCQYEARWRVNTDGTVSWSAVVWLAGCPDVIREASGVILIAPHIDLVDALKRAVESAIEKSGCGSAD